MIHNNGHIYFSTKVAPRLMSSAGGKHKKQLWVSSIPLNLYLALGHWNRYVTWPNYAILLTLIYNTPIAHTYIFRIGFNSILLTQPKKRLLDVEFCMTGSAVKILVFIFLSFFNIFHYLKPSVTPQFKDWGRLFRLCACWLYLIVILTGVITA